MTDRTGKELSIGDYILYHCVYEENSPDVILCRVTLVDADYIVVDYDFKGTHIEATDVTHSERIELLSKEQAMLLKLEGI